MEDTQKHYRVENVSIGAANTVKLDGKDIRFVEATVKDVQKFDARNCKFCRYLNLRNSSFNYIEAQYLNSLLLIDISNTKIQQADFRSCQFLQKVIHDAS